MPIKGTPTLEWVMDYHLGRGHSDDYLSSPRPVGSIAFCAEGTADYLSLGKRFTLTGGDILFIPQGGTYISEWTSDRGRLIAAHFLFSPRGIKYPVSKVSGKESLLDSFTRMLSDWQTIRDKADASLKIDAAASDIHNLSVILHMTGTWNIIMSEIIPELEAIPVPAPDPRVDAAMNYISAHMCERITISDIASAVCVSPSHLHAIFKNTLGVSPIEYKLRLQIDEAQRLLIARPDLTVGEISDRLGFASDIYFRKVFRNQTGMSPTAFRRTPTIM